MKWMSFNRSIRTIEFKLEEHEIVDDMIHRVVFDGPPRSGRARDSVTSAPSKAGPQWNLKFVVPREVDLTIGQWTFTVISEPFMTRGQQITATGFSNGADLICHQAITKLHG